MDRRGRQPLLPSRDAGQTIVPDRLHLGGVWGVGVEKCTEVVGKAASHSAQVGLGRVPERVTQVQAIGPQDGETRDERYVEACAADKYVELVQCAVCG